MGCQNWKELVFEQLSHLTSDETEAQRGKGAYEGSHSIELGWELRPLVFRIFLQGFGFSA